MFHRIVRQRCDRFIVGIFNHRKLFHRHLQRKVRRAPLAKLSLPEKMAKFLYTTKGKRTTNYDLDIHVALGTRRKLGRFYQELNEIEAVEKSGGTLTLISI